MLLVDWNFLSICDWNIFNHIIRTKKTICESAIHRVVFHVKWASSSLKRCLPRGIPLLSIAGLLVFYIAPRIARKSSLSNLSLHSTAAALLPSHHKTNFHPRWQLSHVFFAWISIYFLVQFERKCAHKILSPHHSKWYACHHELAPCFRLIHNIKGIVRGICPSLIIICVFFWWTLLYPSHRLEGPKTWN